MKTFISFSGGVESTTMCILYGKGATAIFSDTGSEHDELYERLDVVEKYCKELHGGDFELIRIRAKVKSKIGEIVDSLSDYIKIYSFMPSGFSRYCTRLFKIEPIDNYLSGMGEVEMMIGLNFDEQGREGNLEKLKNCKYRYPLIENELDRDDCIAILDLHGMNPNFPVYMQRGGCKFCFYKSEAEYKALYYFDRKTFDENKKLEKDIQDKRKRFFSIMPSGKSMQQLENELSFNLFPDDMIKECYQEMKNRKFCGGLCGR